MKCGRGCPPPTRWHPLSNPADRRGAFSRSGSENGRSHQARRSLRTSILLARPLLPGIAVRVTNLASSVLAALPAVAAAQAPSPLWAIDFGGAPITYAFAAGADGSGGAFVAGYVYAVNGLYRPGHGAGDAFLARYSQSGSLIWGRQFGDGEETEEAHATCADGVGGAFVAGTFADGVGGWNEADAFIARFNGTGDELWIRRFGASLADEASATSSDGAGGAYVVGS